MKQCWVGLIYNITILQYYNSTILQAVQYSETVLSGFNLPVSIWAWPLADSGPLNGIRPTRDIHFHHQHVSSSFRFFTQAQKNMKYFETYFWKTSARVCRSNLITSNGRHVEESLCSRLVRTKRRWRSCQARLTPVHPISPNKCFNMTARQRQRHEAQKDESIEHRDQTETPWRKSFQISNCQTWGIRKWITSISEIYCEVIWSFQKDT